MSRDESFTRTVRIAIPFEKSGPKAAPQVPRVVARKKGPALLDESAGAAPFQELLQSFYDGVLITDAAGLKGTGLFHRQICRRRIRTP